MKRLCQMEFFYHKFWNLWTSMYNLKERKVVRKERSEDTGGWRLEARRHTLCPEGLSHSITFVFLLVSWLLLDYLLSIFTLFIRYVHSNLKKKGSSKSCAFIIISTILSFLHSHLLNSIINY